MNNNRKSPKNNNHDYQNDVQPPFADELERVNEETTPFNTGKSNSNRTTSNVSDQSQKAKNKNNQAQHFLDLESYNHATVKKTTRQKGNLLTLLLIIIFMGVQLVIPIANLIFGTKYLGKCPIEPNIPIWLIGKLILMINF
jgi:hypothetical protein